MSTSVPDADPRAIRVDVADAELSVELADGRRIVVPLVWFPRLLRATPAQRAVWRLVGDGCGIHWPEIDEDISVGGLLRGASSPDAARRVG